MKTRTHYLSLGVLACLFLLQVSCGDSSSNSSTSPEGSREVIKREGEPDMVRYDQDDDLMVRAIANAKLTHMQFVKALGEKSTSDSSFAIKKPYPTPEEGFEHIWISDVSWDGSAFSGTINNEPVDTTEVKFGERVQVKPDELSDWMFVRDGVLVGGYTLRVMYSDLEDAEKQAFEQQVGFKIPAIDF